MIDKMKKQRGQLSEDIDADATYLSSVNNSDNNYTVMSDKYSSVKTDNYRVRRYIAKYTINPCMAHGMADEIGDDGDGDGDCLLHTSISSII